MAFVFEGKEYGSKAAVVRDLYDAGEISMASDSKKSIAEKLGMTVQTVHATLVKHTMGAVKVSKPADGKTPTIKPAIQQAVQTAKNRSKGKAIFINDKSEELQKELKKDPNRIKVTWAPNQWGLPVTNPPLEVIDDNYDPNWLPPPEESVDMPY